MTDWLTSNARRYTMVNWLSTVRLVGRLSKLCHTSNSRIDSYSCWYSIRGLRGELLRGGRIMRIRRFRCPKRSGAYYLPSTEILTVLSHPRPSWTVTWYPNKVNFGLVDHVLHSLYRCFQHHSFQSPTATTFIFNLLSQHYVALCCRRFNQDFNQRPYEVVAWRRCWGCRL